MTEQAVYIIVKKTKTQKLKSFEKCVDYCLEKSLSKCKFRIEIEEKNRFINFANDLIQILVSAEDKWVKKVQPDNLEVGTIRFKREYLERTRVYVVNHKAIIRLIRKAFKSFRDIGNYELIEEIVKIDRRKYYAFTENEINQFASFNKCIDFYLHDFLANYEHRMQVNNKYGYSDFKKDLKEVLLASKDNWVIAYDPEIDKIDDYRFSWEIAKGTKPMLVDVKSLLRLIKDSYDSFQKIDKHEKLVDTEKEKSFFERMNNYFE